MSFIQPRLIVRQGSTSALLPLSRLNPWISIPNSLKSPNSSLRLIRPRNVTRVIITPLLVDLEALRCLKLISNKSKYPNFSLKAKDSTKWRFQWTNSWRKRILFSSKSKTNRKSPTMEATTMAITNQCQLSNKVQALHQKSRTTSTVDLA